MEAAKKEEKKVSSSVIDFSEAKAGLSTLPTFFKVAERGDGSVVFEPSYSLVYSWLCREKGVRRKNTLLYEVNGHVYNWLPANIQEQHMYLSDLVHDKLRELNNQVLAGDQAFDRSDVEDVVHKWLIKAKPWSSTSLPAIPHSDPKVLRDTATTTYLPFTNGVVQVDAKGCQFRPYSDFDGYLFDANRVIQREFNPDASNKTVVRLFLSDTQRKDPVRVLAVRTAMGYLVNSYKDQGQTFCPILTEAGGKNGNHGRTGKGIIFKAIRELLGNWSEGQTYKEIKGEALKDKLGEHLLEVVTPSMRVIHLNDLNPEFNPRSLFTEITEDLQINPKHKQHFTVRFEDSPKFGGSTNKLFCAMEPSVADRYPVYYFSNYFSDTFKPRHKYGKMFFVDWDKAEWERFYMWMVQSVHLFHKHGLLRHPIDEGVEANMVRQKTNAEFVDWFQAEIDDGFIFNGPVLVETMFKNFLDFSPDHRIQAAKGNFKREEFSRWIGDYCSWSKAVAVEKKQMRLNGKKPYVFVFERLEETSGSADERAQAMADVGEDIPLSGDEALEAVSEAQAALNAMHEAHLKRVFEGSDEGAWEREEQAELVRMQKLSQYDWERQCHARELPGSTW